MNWFRSNIKLGARLALVALAIQFVLAFGHTHAGVAHAAPVIQSTATGGASDTGNSGSGHDHAGDACAICAVMTLAQSMLSATPPILLLPQGVDLLYRTTAAEFAHIHAPRGAFQPRAPPAS